MAASSLPGELGTLAPDFVLPGIDGALWSRDRATGQHGLLVMFICNHCPYVLAVGDRIAADARVLRAAGIGVVAINSNDATAYPEDAFERMAPFAVKHGFDFPYLHDASQAVARAYGAVCTPDFFGYDAALTLRYRGRLDASGRQPAPPDARRELVEAMLWVAAGRPAPVEQRPSIGCSIKWKTN